MMQSSKKLLAAAVTACSGLAVSSTVSAFAYDSLDHSGIGVSEPHAVATVAIAGVDPCIGGCVAFKAQGVENMGVFLVTNPTPATYDASGNLTSPAFSTTADHTACKSPYNADTVTQDASGNCPPHVLTGFGRSFLPNNFGLYVPTSAEPNKSAWDITTDEEGKMIGSSWFATLTISGGLNFTSVRAFPLNQSCTFSGPIEPGDIDLAAANAMFTNINTDDYSEGCVAAQVILDAISVGKGNPVGAVAVSGAYKNGSAYLTCDSSRECGNFNKAVPVPAFAAAALGLGLLGVTYVTGRRRKIQ